VCVCVCVGRAHAFWISVASCALSLSSQKVVASPVARARDTASLTQSRIGASLV
jgi:phosphohistidine phosphatase SixA